MPLVRPTPRRQAATLLVAGLLAACGDAPPVEAPGAGTEAAPGTGGPAATRPAADTGGDTGAEPAGGPAAERHPLDPDGWQPIAEFQGQAVDTVRVTFDDGRLQRIACYLAGSRRQEDQHGPEWVFFPNGVPRSQSIWVHGTLQGPFVERFPTGVLRREGHYVDGQRHGLFRQYFRSSDLNQEYEYDRGRPHGLWREYFAGHAPAKEERFQDGRLHGVRRVWGRPGGVVGPEEVAAQQEIGPAADGEEGHLLFEETWVEGQLSGPWRSYWPTTGELQFQREYVDGVQQGLEVAWNEDGSKLSETTFVDGRREGPQRLWHPNGQLHAEGRLRDGQRAGPWTYWTPEGDLDEAWTGTYEDDERVGDEPPPR